PDDGGDITVYDLADDKVGVIDYYIHERPGYKESYKGVEFTLTKKFANKWQLLASITYGKTNVNMPIESVDDPNNREFQDGVPLWNDAPLIIKIMGSVELPLGFTFGGFLNYRTGLPSQRYFYTRLNQGDVNVETQKYGTERFPNLLILDLRLSKIFRLGKFGALEIMADVFNVFNSYTTLDWDTESWSGYQDIYTVLAPRILRLGVKWNF
ncbi:MAG: TonB-dependent receptor, partial [Candidatus Aminicenantes bacterium]|nr:TonB-dependent receptor [Candidatus Aminicenantes bacterium]